MEEFEVGGGEGREGEDSPATCGGGSSGGCGCFVAAGRRGGERGERGDGEVVDSPKRRRKRRSIGFVAVIEIHFVFQWDFLGIVQLEGYANVVIGGGCSVIVIVIVVVVQVEGRVVVPRSCIGAFSDVVGVVVEVAVVGRREESRRRAMDGVVVVIIVAGTKLRWRHIMVILTGEKEGDHGRGRD